MKIIRKRYKGQTLISLMLSISLSSFLLFIIVAFFSQSQVKNQQGLLKLQLQTEMQHLIQLMGKDIRRAGFHIRQDNAEHWHWFEQNNGLKSLYIGQANREMENSCILFFYDGNQNGNLDIRYEQKENGTKKVFSEILGYRLDKNMVKIKLAPRQSFSCVAEQCLQYFQSGCELSGWRNLLDPKEYQILKLTFTPISNKNAIEIQLLGALKKHKQIQYETSMLVVIPNED